MGGIILMPTGRTQPLIRRIIKRHHCENAKSMLFSGKFEENSEVYKNWCFEYAKRGYSSVYLIGWDGVGDISYFDKTVRDLQMLDPVPNIYTCNVADHRGLVLLTIAKKTAHQSQALGVVYEIHGFGSCRYERLRRPQERLKEHLKMFEPKFKDKTADIFPEEL